MDKNKKVILFEIILMLLLSVITPIGGATLFYGDINIIDEGQYAAWANHMLLGKYMYRDMYITYGPLAVYPLYTLFTLFSPSAFLVRFYLLLGSILGVGIALRFFYKLHIPFYLRVMGIVFLSIFPVLGWRQAMGLITILILSSLLTKQTVQRGLLLGISNAVTFLISPEIGILLFVLTGLVFLYTLIGGEMKRVFPALLAVLLGVFIIFLPFSLWSMREGWFLAYVITTIDLFMSFSGIGVPNGMNFPVPQQSTWGIISFIFSKDFLLYYLILFYLATFAYLGVRFFLQQSREEGKIVILLAIFGVLLLSLSISRPGIGHVFFTLSPVIILSFYFMYVLFLPVTHGKKGERVVVCFLLSILLIFFLRILFIQRIQIKETVRNMWQSESASNLERVGTIVIRDQQAKKILALQTFIQRHTKESDTIFFFSDAPLFYMLTNRKNPTRFDLPYIAITQEKRYELYSSLDSNTPRFIIVDTNTWDVDGISNKRRLPEIYRLIQKYHEVAFIEGFQVLERPKK